MEIPRPKTLGGKDPCGLLSAWEDCNWQNCLAGTQAIEAEVDTGRGRAVRGEGNAGYPEAGAGQDRNETHPLPWVGRGATVATSRVGVWRVIGHNGGGATAECRAQAPHALGLRTRSTQTCIPRTPQCCA